ncbi:MAG: DMT family transporter [Paracoccaceae bacterium]|nr:DMT family transporter [Paracoccaceae bacterium]
MAIKNAKAHAAAIVAASVAGLTVIFTSILMQSVDPLLAATLRYFVASLSVLPFLIWNWSAVRRISPWDFIAISALGVLFYFLFPFLFNQSLELTTAARGSLIMSLLPIMALSIGVAFKVETLNLFKVLGCGLAILGVGLSVYDGLALGAAGADALTGDLIMIIAVTIAASFTVFSKRYFQRYGSWAVSYIAICAGFLVPLPITATVIDLGVLPALTNLELTLLFLLGTLGVPIQFGLFSWSLNQLGPSRGSMYIVLMPITATILAVIALDETLRPLFVAGLVLIVGAIILVNREPKTSL